MVKTPPRRFNLGDSLILIAGVAAGFALARPAAAFFESSPFFVDPLNPGPGTDAAISRSLLHATPVLLACSLALLAVSLRRPRPPLRRLARRSGFATCAAGALGAPLVLLVFLGQGASTIGGYSEAYTTALASGLPSGVGYLALGAMAVLSMQGRLRPHPSWMDRLGFAAGLGWVALMMLTWAQLYLTAWGFG
jgi:hypothetical protein